MYVEHRVPPNIRIVTPTQARDLCIRFQRPYIRATKTSEAIEGHIGQDGMGQLQVRVTERSARALESDVAIPAMDGRRPVHSKTKEGRA